MVMPLTQGFTLGYIRDGAALGFALLNASASRSDINIISTPQILTIDNQEAELNVGEEIPVMTTNRISDTGTQNQTFDYKTVGMKLKITPHITKSKSITLDLYQEVNSVLGETTNPIVPPKLGKRDIKTKVNVIDGRTIVVGGLIRNDRTSSETKVPLLGDIPLLGWLFKTKSVQYTKKNLLIFITPHIVTKEKQIEGLTKEKLKIHKRMKEKYLKESNW
jgi:general secretion pathway protein D